MIRFDLTDLAPIAVWRGRHYVQLNELTIKQSRLAVRYDVTPPWPRTDDMLPVAMPSITVEDDQGTAYGNSCGLYRAVGDTRVAGLVTCQPAPPDAAEKLTFRLVFEIRQEEYVCEFKLDLGPLVS